MYKLLSLCGSILLAGLSLLTTAAYAVEIREVAATDESIQLEVLNPGGVHCRLVELAIYESYNSMSPPAPVLQGVLQGTISIDRFVNGRDRLYQSFLLTDSANNTPVGQRQFVTNLDALSRVSDDPQGWSSAGSGGRLAVDESKLIITFQQPAQGQPFDPFFQNNRAINAAQNRYFSFRMRMTGATVTQVPFALYHFPAGGGAHGRVPFTVNITGAWQTVHVDMLNSENQPWSGNRTLRLDVPESVANATPYLNATLEIEWIGVSNQPNFAGGNPGPNGFLWDFFSDRNFSYPVPENIKGLQVQLIDDAIELGVNHAGLNVLVNSIVDWSNPNPTQTWTVDGHQIGINMGAVHGLDNQVRTLSDAGMNISLILLNAVPSSPNPDNPFIHPQTLLAQTPNGLGAFNLTNAAGFRAYRAAIEFLAHRYSDPTASSGWVTEYIVGNEVNSHWWWHNQGNITLANFMVDYEHAVRVTDLAVRKYHAEARALISLEHHWNSIFGSNNLRAGRGVDVVELMNQYAKANGDYPWYVAQHPYPENLFEPRFWNDSSAQFTFTTPRITFRNIEILPVYMEQEHLLFKGEPRRIILSEQGFHTPTTGNGQDVQAAAYAYAYYKLSYTRGISSFILHRHVDHGNEGGLLLGLWTRDVNDPFPAQPLEKKRSWFVFRDAGTPQFYETAAFALPIIGLQSWDQALPARTDVQFYFEVSLEGWAAGNQVDNLHVDAGQLSGNALGSDPYLERDNMFLLANNINHIYVRLRANEGNQAEFYWTTAASPNYSETRTIKFPIIGDGQWRTYTVDMSTATGWAGSEIRKLRFDPTNATAEFQIDFITTIAPEPDPEPEIGDHTADSNGDGIIGLAELLRVIQLYNAEAYHCALEVQHSEDGFMPGPGNQDCTPHSSDYQPQDWRISLGELMRLVQFYNADGVAPIEEGEPETEDGFIPVFNSDQ